jgi:hypothetical protein
MRRMVERKSVVFGALMLAGIVSAPLVPALAIGFHQDPQKAEARSPEDVKAEEAFTRNCVKCHPVDRIAGSRRTRTQWEEVMTTMTTARGAVIPDEDWDVIQTYLVKHYGRVNVNRTTRSPRCRVSIWLNSRSCATLFRSEPRPLRSPRRGEAKAGWAEHTREIECPPCLTCGRLRPRSS